MIHPTAIVDPKAKVDPTVEVGPYSVIDGGVTLGPHCVVGPHVHLTGATTAGAHNRFHAGAVIGDIPVDHKYKGEPTRLRIGDHNVFREHVTVNSGTVADGDTVIGSHNLLTPSCHIGHNSAIGDHIVIGGGAMLAGHVVVQDHAIISGNCMVHQFCRVGSLAMMQGGAGISMDLPPFTIATGLNGICGLNVVGLRRAGITSEERLELKRLYQALFRGRGELRSAVAAARTKFIGERARTMLEFVGAAKRGVCRDVGAVAEADGA